MPDTPTELQPAESDPTVADETLSIGSKLCTKCGLCCTGALHDRAVLEPEEVEFASDLGLYVRAEGRPTFALPCKYLQGCACTIYSKRPKVCARYQCQLLDDVRLVQDGPLLAGGLAALRADALVVGGGTVSVRLGYHRHGVRGPAPLRALFSALERRAVVVPWQELVLTDDGPLRLRCRRAELRGLEDV